MSLLEIENLRVGTSDKEIVHGINLTIETGEWLGLIGESGSGKSLTAFSIANLLHPTLFRKARRLSCDGHDLLSADEDTLQSVRGKTIGYVFQDYQAGFSPYYRLGSQLHDVLKSHTDWDGQHRTNRITTVLRSLHLPTDVLNRYPFQVSGGQLQRVALAAAIVLKPKLIIADEITTGLDAVSARLVLDEISQVQTETGCAVLFITHNLRVLRHYAHRVIIMHHGTVREEGPTNQVFEQPQDDVTKNLIAAIPPLRNAPRRLPIVKETSDDERA